MLTRKMEAPKSNVTKNTVIYTGIEKFDLDMACHLITAPDLLTIEEKKKVKHMISRKVRDEKGTSHAVNYFMGKSSDRTSRKGNEYYHIGRYVASSGYQTLQKNVRAALAKNYYFDVDMVNAHPTMLLQMCKQKGWKCRHLEMYVTNREKLFEKMVKEGYTRDECKTAALRIMYGGTPNDETPSWFADKFYVNMQYIMRKIAEAYPNEYAIAQRNRKQYNPLGRCAANIMQTKERECLMAMIKSFEMDDRVVGTLMHDGCFIEKKKEEISFPQDILRKAEEFIFEKTGFRHTLIVKPLETTYEIQRKDLNVLRTYKNIKEKFEELHFKCVNRSGFYKVTNDLILFIKKQDMLVSYEHMKYEEIDKNGEIVTRGFIKKWFEDEDIRKYEDVGVFPPPLQAPQSYYNLWNGFDIERYDGDVDDESLEYLLEHIKLVVGDECYEYVLNWMAMLFQKPGTKPNVCIVIKTKQGLGKGMIFEMLTNMIGRRYCFITEKHERDIFGQFNPLMEGKILVGLDEMNMTISRNNRGTIFNLITGLEETVNSKHKNQHINAGLAHVLVFSNDEWPWKIETGDRRCLAIDTSDKEIPSHSYFEELKLLIEWEPVLKALYNFFLERDLSKFDPKDSRPETTFSKELKTLSLPLEKLFYIDLIDSREDDFYITSNEMYELFKQYLFKNYSEVKVYSSHMKFSMSVNKFGGCTQMRTKISRGYHINVREAGKWILTLSS